MDNSPSRKEQYAAFRKGLIELYMIVDKDYSGTLAIHNTIIRKMDAGMIAVVGWAKESEAQKFLNENIDNPSSWKVVGISASVMKDFFDNLDESSRKFVLLDFV